MSGGGVVTYDGPTNADVAALDRQTHSADYHDGARGDARKRRQEQPESQDRITALLAELDAHALNLWRAADGEGLTPAAAMAAVAAADQASRLAERVRAVLVVPEAVDPEVDRRERDDAEARASAWAHYCKKYGVWRDPSVAHKAFTFGFLAGYDTARHRIDFAASATTTRSREDRP